MSNINKIRLSGTTYDIEDLNAAKTVELTQAEYDALTVKDPNTFYIITDAQAADLSSYYTKTETDGLLDTKLDVSAYTPTDLSNYYTKSETSGATEISTALAGKADTATTYTKTEVDNAITAATSAKQDTLVSGTNIKTVNNESLLGEGNITIEGGGGSVTVDNALSTTSENPVANSAITNVLSAYYYATKTNNSVYNNPFGKKSSNGCVGFSIGFSKITNPNDSSTGGLWVSTINNKDIINDNYKAPNSSTFNLSLVETSSITTSVTSASTDSQVPSAKAVYDALQESGGGTVDTELDSTSENPVQNKVIYQKFDEVEEVTAAALNDLNDKIGDINTLLEGI